MSGDSRTNGRNSGISRRHFLGLSATGIAAATFHGMTGRAYAGTNRSGIPQAIIRTAEHFGDEEMILTFPTGWDIDYRPMVGHDAPEVTDDQIRESLRNTVGTPSLADMASGKRSAIITFDDLTRPTPTYRIVPLVLAELEAAGIPPENIKFQGSFGSHCAMYQQDMALKIGADTVANYECWNHDAFHGFTDYGTTPHGMPVKLCNRFSMADLRITLSGVKKHGLAGYGGGAKAIIPGIAAFESIQYLHETLAARREDRASFYVNSPVRQDMVAAARMAEVNMSINMVMNGHRQVADVYAGDIEQAHHAAVRVAHESYHTDLPEEPADVVIFNHYPQSVEAYFGFGPQALKEGGTIVLVQDTPAGQRKIHYLGWSGNGGNRTRPASGLPVSNAGQVIVFNRFAARWDEVRYSPDVKFARTWDEVVGHLQSHHGDNTKVTVFPTAPLQHEPAELRI